MSASRASISLLRALRTVPVLPRVGQTAVSPRLFLARSLHSTPARLASEVPQDPLADPKIQAFYEKLRNHQGAVDAMMAVAKLMESKGYATDRPPSMMEMAKLSMDKDMRAAGQKLMNEMKAAGVEMKPEMMQAIFSKVKP
ncbi:uncharacterized protein MKK02DRAFT_40838 [Dioszegia hungarica]|uniref:Uncharacterized protein n=1 Tax=Dioszegia hungarica TaxID=4972 RepID=A0AA38LSE9_9TREE|nr:uncharacterized protein MKK02DRAFT_40838 [Dioszegia hungarica]KAI9632534.1 hypothetical protein MKK02DRAFT_40838 [Dioszegia hungarica]